MKKRISIVLALVFLIGGVSGCIDLSGKVAYEIVTSLPEDSHVEDIERDKYIPVTIAVKEEYISVLPPYGYKIEFIDVVRDGGITMLYNLVKLDDPNGEAPALTVKVSNPRKGPLGASCQNLDILNNN
jgi:hypothetical protein